MTDTKKSRHYESSLPMVSRRNFVKSGVLGGVAAYLAACDTNTQEEFFAKRFTELTPEALKERIAWLEKHYEKTYGEAFKVGTEGPIPDVLFGYALDLSRCVGCRRCAYACVSENNLSRDPQVHYIRVLEQPKGTGLDLHLANPYYERDHVPEEGHVYLPVACQQCENSPCERVCPVGATWKEPDGVIVVDYDWCIGCRYCMASCPYGARKFNWGAPKMTTGDSLAVKVLSAKPKGEGRFEVIVEEALDAPERLQPPHIMPTVVKRPFLDAKGNRFMTETLPVADTNPAARSTTRYRFEVVAKEAPATSSKDDEYGYFLDAVNPDTHYLGNRPRKKGVVEKCHFCLQRTRNGEYPACAEICPVGSRKFGNLLDPDSEIRYVLANKRVFVLKEELNTRPKFFYFFGV
ncbi:MAG: 4Fe-4S dicluster domain-containing protein [Deltaproteobacteria bacterium]|nr:4Fe-4S dicluster domain-containing protein [Deltaproteobacteria bacterium]